MLSTFNKSKCKIWDWFGWGIPWPVDQNHDDKGLISWHASVEFSWHRCSTTVSEKSATGPDGESPELETICQKEASNLDKDNYSFCMYELGAIYIVRTGEMFYQGENTDKTFDAYCPFVRGNYIKNHPKIETSCKVWLNLRPHKY